jgi:signal transduction histidine kinase
MVSGVEVFADPLFPLICQNLVDNSIRHGGSFHMIQFRITLAQSGLTFIYEDDGVGIPEEEKKKVFERGFGKNTGMGLFLSQEILAITGLYLEEKGIYGSGVRFEILFPIGTYQIINNS